MRVWVPIHTQILKQLVIYDVVEVWTEQCWSSGLQLPLGYAVVREGKLSVFLFSLFFFWFWNACPPTSFSPDESRLVPFFSTNAEIFVLLYASLCLAAASAAHKVSGHPGPHSLRATPKSQRFRNAVVLIKPAAAGVKRLSHYFECLIIRYLWWAAT